MCLTGGRRSEGIGGIVVVVPVSGHYVPVQMTSRVGAAS